MMFSVHERLYLMNKSVYHVVTGIRRVEIFFVSLGIHIITER